MFKLLASCRLKFTRGGIASMLLGFTCVGFIAYVLASTFPRKSVNLDPQTVLVLFGTRHGNRNPPVFLDENPRTWGQEGDTELTSIHAAYACVAAVKRGVVRRIFETASGMCTCMKQQKGVGKRQALGLGKELRRFVGSFVSDYFNRSEANYYSSSANRCQMTLQVVLAGFYRPVGWAIWDKSGDLAWSPVPYAINDQMLRMYAVDECKNNDRVWKPIDEESLPHLIQAKRKTLALRSYVAKKTGWDMKSVGKLADLADNLIEINLYNATYPEWVLHPDLCGYDKNDIIKEIMRFAELHQIACANYVPCRDLMAGVWLMHILDRITDAKKGKAPKIVAYVSHTEVTLSVMKLLGIIKEDLTTSAGFVIEYRSKPMPSVRLLNHDPNPVYEHVIYKHPTKHDFSRLKKEIDDRYRTEMGGLFEIRIHGHLPEFTGKLVPALAEKMDIDGFLSLQDFICHVSPKAISDWKTACGIPSGCSI